MALASVDWFQQEFLKRCGNAEPFESTAYGILKLQLVYKHLKEGTCGWSDCMSARTSVASLRTCWWMEPWPNPKATRPVAVRLFATATCSHAFGIFFWSLCLIPKPVAHVDQLPWSARVTWMDGRIYDNRRFQVQIRLADCMLTHKPIERSVFHKPVPKQINAGHKYESTTLSVTKEIKRMVVKDH